MQFGLASYPERCMPRCFFIVFDGLGSAIKDYFQFTSWKKFKLFLNVLFVIVFCFHFHTLLLRVVLQVGEDCTWWTGGVKACCERYMFRLSSSGGSEIDLLPFLELGRYKIPVFHLRQNCNLYHIFS